MNLFKKLVHQVALPVLVSSIPSMAISDSGDLKPAVEVKSVWDLSLQPCNGGGGNLMKRNPSEAEVKKTSTLKLQNIGFEFAIPQLPNYDQTFIKLFLNDKSRKVIDHYILLTHNDFDPPDAAVVITELPPNIMNAESAFAIVRSMQKQMARKAGTQISLESVGGPYGESLELLVKNRIGTHCFPTSDYQVASGETSTRTIGISRFAVIQQKLVEFALVLKVSDGIEEVKAIEDARKVMDQYWLQLKKI